MLELSFEGYTDTPKADKNTIPPSSPSVCRSSLSFSMGSYYYYSHFPDEETDT